MTQISFSTRRCVLNGPGPGILKTLRRSLLFSSRVFLLKITFQPLAKADIMKLTERGAASLNSIVYLSRALISLTALNSGVRGMLTPDGGFAIRSNVAFTSADVKAVPS